MSRSCEILTATVTAVVVWSLLVRQPTGVIEESDRVRREPPIPAEAVPLTDVALKGSRTAVAGMLVFSDFECPYCGKFATEVFPQVVTTYVETGKLLFGFRHLPIEAIHQDAKAAAEIAVCAEQYGVFWDVHDEFFKPARKRGIAEFHLRAERAGLPRERLSACAEDDRARAWVDKDIALARSLQLRSTPVFLIGTVASEGLKVVRVFRGAKPWEEFQKVIDEVVKKSTR